jgi:hypothetical protein
MIDPHTPERQWLLNQARECGDRLFNPATGLCLVPRDTLWYAISLLLHSAPVQCAQGVLLMGTIAGGDGTHTPATMLAILHALGDVLSEPVKTHMRGAIAADLTTAAGVVWRDGNVNHPLGAYATLILGGEMCEAQWAVEIGKRRLREFQTTTGDRRGRGKRQAAMSEYNSLTYTALDLVFLALIAEYARDPEARALGAWLQERVWIDCAVHYHEPSQQFAGPHSRSYQEDSTGGFSSLHAVLYAATGWPLYLDPSLCVRFDHPSTLLQCALTAITPFHLSDDVVGLFRAKPLPMSVRMTTYSEQYHENVAGQSFPFDYEVYAGGWRELSTYMTGEYAMGTASLPYVNGGHMDQFMVRIRRSSPVVDASSFRSIYMRGVYNGAVVGKPNHCHVTGGQIDASYLSEEARYGIYQHRNIAIVFASPKRAGHEGISSFRLDLIAGWAVPFDDLVIDGRVVSALPADAAAASRIMFRDARTFGAIIPLVLDPYPGRAPIRLWTANGHMMISLYNHDGPSVDVTREDLLRWRNGCIVHLSTADTWTSFGEFCDALGKAGVTDTIGPDNVRRVRVVFSEGTLSVAYDPGREVFLSRMWNDVEEQLEHLEIEAGESRLPLLDPLTVYGSEARAR